MHLPQRQTWGHMISSFKFINHIVLCHLASPHKSIPSPRSSQCSAPPLRTHLNQSHRPDLVSVVRPHGTPPQINSIAPIQSRAPMARPHTQSHRPHPASVGPPWHAPTNQSHLPYPVARPHDASPLINAIAPFQPVSCTPINQYHHPGPASVTRPHQSNHCPYQARVARPHGAPLWINPIAPILPVSQGPMACPHESIPSPWSSQCRAPPWRNPTNQSHHPDPVEHPVDASP